MILAAPKISALPAGTQLMAGMGVSTIVAEMDFETFSPAGYVWNEKTRKYESLNGTNKKGLGVVNVARYTEHPGAEVISLAYNLKDGAGPKLWTPKDPPPLALFEHINNGELIEAWNIAFEYWTWVNICVKKYNWPPLSVDQLRCAMAKSRAHALPGGLGEAGKVLNITAKKDKNGERLIKLFTVPKNPSKKDPRTRVLTSEEPVDGPAFYQYNLRDIEAEAELSSLIPDLSPSELEFWQVDRTINLRGVRVDETMIDHFIAIVEQAIEKYNRELYQVTGGKVSTANEGKKFMTWLATQGAYTKSMDKEHVEELLKRNDLTPPARRSLEIRQLIGSAAVKKTYAMKNQMTSEKRLHELFVYHSARTGRAAGAGPQPQNFPNGGPATVRCDCSRHYCETIKVCPWCGDASKSRKSVEWGHAPAEDALETIATRSLSCVEYYWGNALNAISGCLRSLFIPSLGHDFICSDFSSIEAVCTAMIAREQWRIDVFRTHGKMYEMSASKIYNIPFEDFLKYVEDNNGKHHPKRKQGKVSELASGFGGYLGAWLKFGAGEFLSEDEIKQAVHAWRDASPAIVEFWGGQFRNYQNEYYGLEGAALCAVMNKGQEFDVNGIKFQMVGDTLYCKLLSGRYLTYHRPRIGPADAPRRGYALSYEGQGNEKGKKDWQRIRTYGGKLCENVIQATARDILAHAMINLEKAGYKIVLHIHDEIVAEVPEGSGSVDEFERIMSRMPDWAADWPIKAKGGWRAKRYSK